MQNHDRETKALATAEQTTSAENGHADLAPAEAAKIETAPLVDGPLFLRCFGNAPNAFVS